MAKGGRLPTYETMGSAYTVVALKSAQACQRRECMGALLSVFAFNHEREPISYLITYNRTTSGFKVKSCWHKTLCHCEHVVA